MSNGSKVCHSVEAVATAFCTAANLVARHCCSPADACDPSEGVGTAVVTATMSACMAAHAVTLTHFDRSRWEYAPHVFLKLPELLLIYSVLRITQEYVLSCFFRVTLLPPEFQSLSRRFEARTLKRLSSSMAFLLFSNESREALRVGLGTRHTFVISLLPCSD